jgi:Uma2 family endonuclease
MADPIRRSDRLFTYADYESWPDDERWELINGIAWNMSPAPGRTHQLLAGRLYGAFAAAVAESGCTYYPAPFDVFLPADPGTPVSDIDTVVQPDLTLVCRDDRVTERGCIGPPDLVVEILSPYTLLKDIDAKRRVYERARVREYWLIDPGNKGLLVYLLRENGTYPGQPSVYQWEGILTTPLLPSLRLDLEELFRGADG